MSDCRICGGAITRTAMVREMMFGTRQPFAYALCGDCGSWQIVTIPADLATYYGAGYLSHQPGIYGAAVPPWQRWLRRLRARAALGGRSTIGALLNRWRGEPQFGQQWLRQARVGLRSRILEVGTGAGMRLQHLAQLGFRHLVGQDLFSLKADSDSDGIRWTRTPLHALEPGFDWIEAHHAFEHFPDPVKDLGRLRELLLPGGGLLLRVPLIDSHAAEEYGTDWVQWDAPRHLYLFTRRALEQLAQRCGLRLVLRLDDSGPFGFWGSWLYRQDIPLNDPRARVHGPSAICPADRWAAFEAQARAANAAERGDQAAFVFVRD